MSLAASAVRRPVATIAAILAALLLGGVSLTRLPVSLLPDVTLPLLTVRTVYPGSAATEVSRFVAEPIEQAIAALAETMVTEASVIRSGTMARIPATELVPRFVEELLARWASAPP